MQAAREIAARNQVFRPNPKGFEHRSRFSSPHSALRTTHRSGRVSLPSVTHKTGLTVAISPQPKITYVPSSALLRAADTLDVACDAPACTLRQKSLCVSSPARTDFEPRIGSTGADAQPWDPPSEDPPGFRLPALLSAPYAGVHLPARRSEASVTHCRSSAWGGIARCRKSVNLLCSGWFQQIGDDVR
jgi:hypothetical protein